MKRFGLEWDSARIEGKRYVHVGLFVQAPRPSRTSARIAAVVAVATFIVWMCFVVPDADIHHPSDLDHGITQNHQTR